MYLRAQGKRLMGNNGPAFKPKPRLTPAQHSLPRLNSRQLSIQAHLNNFKVGLIVGSMKWADMKVLQEWLRATLHEKL